MQLRSFRVRHHGLHDFSAPLRADEETERDVLIAIYFHVSTRQVLEKQINSRSPVILSTLLGITAALDDVQKLIELNHFRAIVIHRLHDLLNLLPVVDEAESNQGILQLVDTDAPGAIIVE